MGWGVQYLHVTAVVKGCVGVGWMVPALTAVGGVLGWCGNAVPALTAVVKGCDGVG